jgi:hypothetical protein
MKVEAREEDLGWAVLDAYRVHCCPPDERPNPDELPVLTDFM